MSEHRCAPMPPHCCCYLLADEPAWDCPIHGGGIINRCVCGRFVRPTCYEAPPADDAVARIGEQVTGGSRA